MQSIYIKNILFIIYLWSHMKHFMFLYNAIFYASEINVIFIIL